MKRILFITGAPSASPSDCPIDSSCVGGFACRGRPIELVGCNSCNGYNACYEIDIVSTGYSIGNNACNGGGACGNIVSPKFDSSCNGREACNRFVGTMGSNSCNCEGCCWCLPHGTVVEDNSCNNPGDCCTEDGYPLEGIGEGSCSHQGEQYSACKWFRGTIGKNSCIGGNACHYSFIDIGDNSCHGENSCQGIAGLYPNDSSKVGSNSCVGSHACQLMVYANIGTNSCNGNYACNIHYTDSLTVGDNSCNCPDCCRCLAGYKSVKTVPSNSCNSLAPSPDDIDWVNNGEGPYTYCCSSV